MKQVTLLFLLKPESREILLAMKKRGFGVGKFNGVGGKVAEDESIESAAVREAQEEIGVEVVVSDLHKVALITFHFDQKPGLDLQCTVFTTHAWLKNPIESEEMAPRWFGIDEIPYEQMWVDDKIWLPRVLGGEKLEATFIFTQDGATILNESIQTAHF